MPTQNSNEDLTKGTNPTQSAHNEDALVNRITDTMTKIESRSDVSSVEMDMLSDIIQEIQASRKNLKRLHQVSVKTYDSIEEMFHEYLKIGCEILQLELGIISKVTTDENKYVVKSVYPANKGILKEDIFELNATYCATVIQNRETITYSEVGAIESMATHPVYLNMGLEAYIGTPIMVEGELYGTLNFTSRAPRKNQFGNLETEFMEIMGQQIASAIVNERAARRNREVQTYLQNNEELLRMFVKHTPAAIAMFDKNVQYLICSDRWKVDYNIEDQEVIGRSHYDVFPEIGEDWKAIHQRCLRGHVERCEEDRFLRVDGSVTWLQWEVRPWYIAGEIGGIIMFTEVITQRKEAELALQQQKTLYQTLVSHLPDISTLLYDKSLRISIADGAYMRRLGYDLEAILGKTLLEVVPERIVSTLEPLYRRALDGESIQLENKATDGSIYDAHFVPIHDPEGDITHVLITVQDITVRKKAELELQSLNRKLVRMNEEVQQFAYIVSHDMRAPLVNLKGFASLLLESTEKIQEVMSGVELEDEQQKEDLEQALTDRIPTAVKFIFSSVDRMDRFSQSILELSRIERRSVQYHNIEVQPIVQQIISSLSHELQNKSIDIAIDELPAIYGDEISVDQIFGNIISNAVKYLPKDRTGHIKIGAEIKDNKVLFSVKDNGVGIAEKDYQKVFAPFRRIGRNTVEGEGMGLAYVQAQVRRHGGEIWFESEVDNGTTFYFTLPNKNLNEDNP